jgi:hypothetical protein
MESSMRPISKSWTIESLELSTVPWVPVPMRVRAPVDRNLAIKPGDLGWLWEVIRPRLSRRSKLCLGMGTLAVLGARSFLREYRPGIGGLRRRRDGERPVS